MKITLSVLNDLKKRMVHTNSVDQQTLRNINTKIKMLEQVQLDFKQKKIPLDKARNEYEKIKVIKVKAD